MIVTVSHNSQMKNEKMFSMLLYKAAIVVQTPILFVCVFFFHEIWVLRYRCTELRIRIWPDSAHVIKNFSGRIPIRVLIGYGLGFFFMVDQGFFSLVRPDP